MQTRREFIRNAAMLTGAAGFAAGVPGSVARAYAIEPAPGTSWKDAEHVVILMQENRSFDHALGTLQGVRGFNDPRAVRQANGNSIFLQTSIDGETFAPWRLDIKDTKITWMGSISHERHTQVDAWNRGHHNAWIDAKRSHNQAYSAVPITMGHYTREDLPFYYALADAFTVCDQHYCGVMTSTTPNRSMFWTGTVRDAQNVHSSVYMRNPEFGHGKLKWTTFPERLQEAGIDWKIYQNELGLADLDEEEHGWLGNLGNMTESFAAYHVNLSDANVEKLKARLAKAQKELEDLEASPEPIEPSLKADRKVEVDQKEAHVAAMQEQVKKGGGGLENLPAEAQELHGRAFVTNVGDEHFHDLEAITFEDGGKTETMRVPRGDVLYQLRKDVDEGKLPAISWLSPPGKFSDHPSNPWYGAWYVSEVVDILTKNPEVWKKTIFILTYDENDGYFDHCPPFVAADPADRATGRASEGVGTGLDYTYAADEIAQGVTAASARSGPIGLGFRVPMIVASPWSRGGWVNSQVFEHTSTLQFLEQFVKAKASKDVTESNITQFRRTVSGNLTSIFRPAEVGSKKELPFLDRDKFVESIEKAKYKEIPSNYNKLSGEQVAAYNRDPAAVPNMARQEPGIRPACALPYELYCEGEFHADKGAFALAMRAGRSVHGERSQGAPFNVYIRNAAKSSGVLERGKKNTNMFVATFAVAAGDTIQEGIPLGLFAGGRYAIDVHGPNGFYREFQGDATACPILTRCAYERTGGGLTGNVLANVRNVSSGPVKVTVADNSYKTGTQTVELAAGEMKSIPVEASKSHGWYDVTVQVSGSATHVRYAGRVETGRASMTDPLMGGVA